MLGGVGKDSIEHAKARIRDWLNPALVDDDWTEDEIVGWSMEIIWPTRNQA